MEKGLKKTIYGLVIISVSIILIGLVVFKNAFPGKYFSFFPFLILFIFLVNAGFFVLFYRSLNRSSNAFIRTFMISTGAKLILYMILILVYVFASPKTALVFAITLFASYILFTAYDLWVMLTLLKHKKENSNLSK
jgi:hypothetical protein